MSPKTTRAELELRISELEAQLAEAKACVDFFGVDAPAGLVIFDQNCRFVQLNPYLARFANLSIAEHIGKKPSDLLPPQLATHIESNVRKILTTGEPQLNTTFTLSLPGDSVPRRHWRTSRFPLRNAAGVITRVGFVVVEETSLQLLRKSLNRQEALQLALLEAIPSRIFMKDREGSYLYCNDIFAADVGLAKAEIIGKNDFDLFRSDMAVRYRQADLEVIASGRVLEFEYQFEKDHREYFINVRKTPFRDSEGKILGILGIFQDLSEKRLKERQLLIADQALTSSLAGIFITDPDGTITYANSAFLKMWGLGTPEEIIGHTARKLWTRPPVSIDGLIATLLNSGSWQGELIGRRQDGTFFDALLTANVVKDGSQQILCLMGSMVDITARKAAEKKLLDSEEQLRQITSHIDDALWIMDTVAMQMLYVSPAFEKIWGAPGESLYHNPDAFLEAVHPEDREKLMRSRHQLGRERKNSYRVIRPDGGIRQVFARIFPVLDATGRVYREVGIVQDVTEMKEAETKILSFSRRLNNAIEEERSAIARDLHDEFGQALVRLRQWQKNTGDALPPTAQALVDHEGFDEIVNRLGTIIRNTTHRLRPDILDNLGLAAAIEREVKEFRRRFESVEVSFLIIGQPRPIDSEHALVFYRVLQEAMTNVARHAGATNLQIRLIFSFPKIILTVDDNGTGFDPANFTGLDKNKEHWGLRGIGERMATIGGRARITSRPGMGTSIRAELTEKQNGPTNDN